MDFCGWMEVYLGGSWWTFDPATTNEVLARFETTGK